MFKCRKFFSTENRWNRALCIWQKRKFRLPLKLSLLQRVFAIFAYLHICVCNALCTIRQICLSYFSRQSWCTPRSRSSASEVTTIWRYTNVYIIIIIIIWSANSKAKPSMLYVTCCTDAQTFRCGLKMRNTEHFGIAICSCHNLAHSISLFTAVCKSLCNTSDFVTGIQLQVVSKQRLRYR